MNYRTSTALPLYLLTFSLIEPLLTQEPVYDQDSIEVRVPEAPLGKNSLEFKPKEERSFTEWRTDEHRDAFQALQKTIAVWEKSGIGSQYFVFGKAEGDLPFRWEAVPFSETPSLMGRHPKILRLLWNICFGASELSPRETGNQIRFYEDAFNNTEMTEHDAPHAEGNDSFCQNEVIQRQSLLNGEAVLALYNYAPIDLDGDKLHFLVIPKEHRATFRDLTKNEYLQSLELAKQLIAAFPEKDTAYLYHKSGANAGQTVPHWHLHVVLTSFKTDTLYQKWTAFRNMAFRSSAMNEEELNQKVASLRQRLAPVDK